MHASKNKKNIAFVTERKDDDIFGDIRKEVTVRITRQMCGSKVRDYIRLTFDLENSKASWSNWYFILVKKTQPRH
jgi:hypothetical protein